MFDRFIKDKQLVDIVKTKNGGMYLTANFKDEYYPTSKFFYKQPFKIKENEDLIDLINTTALKYPEYEIKCKFKSPFGTDFIKKTTFKEYILRLEEIIKEKTETSQEFFKNHNEKFNRDKIIKEVREYYYAQTFKRILKKTTINNFDVEFLPTNILINKGEKYLSVIGEGMDEIFGYGNAKIDLYELTKTIPRKKIIPFTTYIVKKINSGFISRLCGYSGIASENILKEMEKEGRYVDFNGFPAIITFYSEFDHIDAQLKDIRNYLKK